MAANSSLRVFRNAITPASYLRESVAAEHCASILGEKDEEDREYHEHLGSRARLRFVRLERVRSGGGNVAVLRSVNLVSQIIGATLRERLS